jgi:hypothetical protein
MSRPRVRPGSIVVYSDLGCPWATVAITRLLRARAELDADDQVQVDYRCFLLEDINARPTPKPVIDAEIPVVRTLEPMLGWTSWQRDLSTWPVTPHRPTRRYRRRSCSHRGPPRTSTCRCG